MVLLSAHALNVEGRYEFRIEAEGFATATTSDPVKAARLLSLRGVIHPADFVEHVQLWGMVEIAGADAGLAK